MRQPPSTRCAHGDGYRFGNVDVYNPWATVNYFQKGCVADDTTGAAPRATRCSAISSRRRDINSRQALRYGAWRVVREPLNLSVVFPDEAGSPGALAEHALSGGATSPPTTSRHRTTPASAAPAHPQRRDSRAVPHGDHQAILLHRRLARPPVRLPRGPDGGRRGCRRARAGEHPLVLSWLLRSCSENSYHMLVLGLLFGMEGYQDPLSSREAGAGASTSACYRRRGKSVLRSSWNSSMPRS